MSLAMWQREWFTNVKGDLLAGMVVALALIPEAIAFSIIAGVDPKVGLYASFTMAVIIAFMGGRPGMISAATGAMALLMVYLVQDRGLEYLYAAGILTGLMQIGLGFCKIGQQMKYIPRAVIVGFMNSLAILIFMAQLPQLQGASLAAYAMVGLGVAIIYLLPQFTKILPSPLVAIVIVTAISLLTKADVPTVGDMGKLPSAFPGLHLPQVPLTFETLSIIFPFSLAMCVVGLLESFLTASVIDDLTDTPSNKNQEAKGQGIANIVTSFFGGMAGCAMIGQSIINIRSGGRNRLSTLCAGCFLLFLVLVMGDWLERIPMAALVAVMIVVSIGTFNWGYLRQIQVMPISETIVMVTTVVTAIVTHNLAIGVGIGVALSAVFFTRKIAQLVFVDSTLSPDGAERIYKIGGQLFFVSVDALLDGFNFDEELEWVILDLTQAHLWDQSAVMAIDKIVLKFRRKGVEVKLVGLNEASATLVDKLAIHDKAEALQDLSAH